MRNDHLRALTYLKQLYSCIFALALIITTLSPLTANGQVLLPIGQKIIETAIFYGVDPMLALQIAQCESGLRHDGIYGDRGLAYGLYQFHETTFDAFRTEAEMPILLYKDRDSQIELFSWAIANGKAQHWTCYRLVTRGP